MRWKFFRSKEDGGRKTDSFIPTAVIGPPSAIRCPLCGKQFRADEAQACVSCALARKCGLVMCPNCSYEFAG